MMKIKIDEEFKNLVPPLTDEEYKLLEESILMEGLRERLLVWNDTIVDGHNRYEICKKHDIPVDHYCKLFQSREEAMLWIIDNQKGRRNLTTNQKIEIGFKRAELLKPKAEENQAHGQTAPGRTLSQKSDKAFEPVDTLKEAADYAGVSRDTASKYKKIQESDNEEVKEKVDSGELSINKGYQGIKGKGQANRGNKSEAVKLGKSVHGGTEKIDEGRIDSLVLNSIEEVVRRFAIIRHPEQKLSAINKLKEKLSVWSEQLKGD